MVLFLIMMVGAASACDDDYYQNLPSGAVKCATEGGTCRLGPGGGRVYYGKKINPFWDTKWQLMYRDYSTENVYLDVACTNNEFCDVTPMHTKYCYKVDSDSVSCGGHAADTCADCPTQNGVYYGANWCNGECHWENVDNEGCYPNTVSCGNHYASDCYYCPWQTRTGIWKGSGYCNGECTWNGNECTDQNAADTVTELITEDKTPGKFPLSHVDPDRPLFAVHFASPGQELIICGLVVLSLIACAVTVCSCCLSKRGKAAYSKVQEFSEQSDLSEDEQF